jgi:hypothetical protein
LEKRADWERKVHAVVDIGGAGIVGVIQGVEGINRFLGDG